MLLRQTLLEEDELRAKRTIEKLQRDVQTWVITNWEYEEKYEAVMDWLRLRFMILLDGRSLDAYNTYKNVSIQSWPHEEATK
jgi:hypothetical protein